MTTKSPDRLFQRIQPSLVVFSASLFFFFEFMQVNMFNALDPSLYIAFHLTNATQLGQLSACYMYAIVFLLYPAGLILDRVSPRLIIRCAMALCATCALLFSFTTTLFQAELCRLLTGLGGAFCLLSCVRLASRWFPPKHMALVVGLIVTFAMIGGMVAQTPFTKMTEAYGWRNTLRIDAAVGFAMWLLVVAFVRDYPSNMKTFFETQQRSLEKVGFWFALRKTLSNTQNWLGGIYTSLINIPVFLLGSTWGSWYLMQTQHLSADDASYVTSMLFLGLIVGSPALGWFSDFLSQRKLPMILGAIASLGVISAIMYIPNLSLDDLLFLFFALGFVISSQIIGYALVAESNPIMLTGAAEGVASVLIMSGGFLIPIFPMLLNLHWNHAMKNGIPQYSAHDYHLAFLIMPIAFAIALIASFIMRETYSLSYEEQSVTEPTEAQVAA